MFHRETLHSIGIKKPRFLKKIAKKSNASIRTFENGHWILLVIEGIAKQIFAFLNLLSEYLADSIDSKPYTVARAIVLLNLLVIISFFGIHTKITIF